MICRLFFVLIIVAAFPVRAADTGLSLVFLPSYFKCTYDAQGRQTCVCWDAACQPIACPPETPWKHRPECLKGAQCAPYAGPYGCRIDAYDGRARPTVRQ